MYFALLRPGWRRLFLFIPIALLARVSAAAAEEIHDHAQMDHSKMDHAMPAPSGSAPAATKPKRKKPANHTGHTTAATGAAMDHSQMDHSKMGHGEMKGLLGPYPMTREARAPAGSLTRRRMKASTNSSATGA